MSRADASVQRAALEAESDDDLLDTSSLASPKPITGARKFANVPEGLAKSSTTYGNPYQVTCNKLATHEVHAEETPRPDEIISDEGMGLAYFLTSVVPAPFNITGKEIKIQFASGDSLTAAGFQITFEATKIKYSEMGMTTELSYGLSTMQGWRNGMGYSHIFAA
ncbi:unnamed protein product [Clavelina lepadiformis]|uniref:CUB domain-containing protein n=1 Tax=Clavelina lepadiformis TaxID=159417 RepID=A0ABP0FW50_CLALP